MSASVIDAFITTLGLDGTLFRKGMKDAEKSQKDLDAATKRSNADREKQERAAADARKKRQQEQDEQSKRTVEGYKKIRNELLAVAAIFTAGVGIKDFISNTINSAANLGYLSANLKQSTQELTAWQRASERAGGSGDGIIAQMKESAATLAQLRAGMGPNEGMQNFFRWGGNPDDLKDGNTYLLARSRIIHDMFAVDPAKAALVAKSMGINEDQFDFLKQGPDAVMALVRAQEKNSAVTAKDAAAALELKNKMLDLRDSLQATATRIVLQLAPAIERMFARLEEGAQWVAAHKDDIARWVENCVNWIAKFATVADSAAQSVGGWQNVLIGLAAFKVASMAVGFAQLAGSLAQVAASLLGISGGGAALGILGRLGLVGAAGAAGYGIGTLINDYLPESAKDKIGSGVAHIVAALGGKDAKAAVAQNDKAPSVVDKLKAMGWTPEQAAGIAGSFMQESGLNPAARNPKSGAYGIGQWLGSRVKDFRLFTGHNLEGSSLDEQLAFFNYEVTQGKERKAGMLLRAAKTAEFAARVHSSAYERPGAAEANVARRQKLAAQFAASDRMSNAAAAGALPAGAAASAGGINSHTSTSTSDTRIDTINVYTQATDAQGVADALRPAVEQYSFATQANTGMR